MKHKKAPWGLIALFFAIANISSAATSDDGGVQHQSFEPTVVSVPHALNPHHYIVFEIDSKREVHPLFYQKVQLTETWSAESFDADTQRTVTIPGLERVRITAAARDELLREWTIQVPTHIRGEFAVNPSVDDRIASVRVNSSRRSFVLRVPAVVETINVTQNGSQTSFELGALSANSNQLPLAKFAADIRFGEPSASEGTNTNSANRVDLLVMGDGYTNTQQTKFQTDVASLGARFFEPQPFGQYRSFVNWRPFFVASMQAGADHPPYQAGCNNLNCCADVAAQTDPFAGQFVNTAFDARFCAANVHRLLIVDTAKAQTAAAGAPDWDKIIMLVNDPVYGGSGGSIAVGSLSSEAAQVMVHEYGHSFTRLADEYSTPFPGFPACSDLSSPASCEANVTNQSNPNLVKWRARFTPGIAIPTPNGSAGLGLFPGARYLSEGMYRPENQCLMQSLNRPFCDVCREAYVRMLYTGGFGVPSSGISLIEPGSEMPPINSSYTFEVGQTAFFSIQVVSPNSNTTAVQWYLNNQPLTGANSPGVALTFTNSSSLQQLRVDVMDQGSYLLPADQGISRKTRTWIFQVDSTLFRNGFEVN